MFLLDTNIISELRKGSRCNAGVSAWFGAASDTELFTSVVVIGELRRGVERARGRDPRHAAALERWLQEVAEYYGDRVLPIDARVGDAWGRLSARRSLPVVDGLLAATARVHDMTLVTRNTVDVEGIDVSLLNPFRT